ncbi:MAG: hypothetical protein IKO57_01475 [Treponema sp.]|nr:hypothetical protein [Treponema sp.]MBR4629100.1 hypothetical protein [Treponema sp.]MCR5124918.1 hypothetical protein [Treponema sp.]
MIAAILYYIISSSAILFYGIGISRTINLKDDFSLLFLSCVKALFTTASTTSVSYLICYWLLVPIHISELYPFVTVILFLFFSIFIEIFIGIGIKKSPAEFSITILSSILALNEGLSIGHAVIIACSCIISFYLLICIFHSIRVRVSFYTNPAGIKIYPVLLLSLAASILAIFGWNISWFNIL